MIYNYGNEQILKWLDIFYNSVCVHYLLCDVILYFLFNCFSMIYYIISCCSRYFVTCFFLSVGYFVAYFSHGFYVALVFLWYIFLTFRSQRWTNFDALMGYASLKCSINYVFICVLFKSIIIVVKYYTLNISWELFAWIAQSRPLQVLIIKLKTISCPSWVWFLLSSGTNKYSKRLFWEARVNAQSFVGKKWEKIVYISHNFSAKYQIVTLLYSWQLWMFMSAIIIINSYK